MWRTLLLKWRVCLQLQVREDAHVHEEGMRSYRCFLSSWRNVLRCGRPLIFVAVGVYFQATPQPRCDVGAGFCREVRDSLVMMRRWEAVDGGRKVSEWVDETGACLCFPKCKPRCRRATFNRNTQQNGMRQNHLGLFQVDDDVLIYAGTLSVLWEPQEKLH